MSSNRSDQHSVPRQEARPPAPPPWAARSLSEDDGITHELISPVHPTVRWRGPGGWLEMPSDVSLTTTDQPTDSGWCRLLPTIQIEGGSYTLHGARQLRDILDSFLASAASDDADATR